MKAELDSDRPDYRPVFYGGTAARGGDILTCHLTARQSRSTRAFTVNGCILLG
jgi:hypothetical protein